MVAGRKLDGAGESSAAAGAQPLHVQRDQGLALGGPLERDTTMLQGLELDLTKSARKQCSLSMWDMTRRAAFE